MKKLNNNSIRWMVVAGVMTLPACASNEQSSPVEPPITNEQASAEQALGREQTASVKQPQVNEVGSTEQAAPVAQPRANQATPAEPVSSGELTFPEKKIKTQAAITAELTASNQQAPVANTALSVEPATGSAKANTAEPSTITKSKMSTKPTAAKQAVTSYQYEFLETKPEGKPARYTFVAKLINVSSGAKLVKGSTNPDAHQEYQQARDFYQQATDASDQKQVNMYLNMAVGKMYRAIQLATPKEMTDVKHKRDFDKRLKSVEALSTAYQRVAIEKNVADKGETVLGEINVLVANAKKHAVKHDYKLAQSKLDESYQLVKSSIELMRGGETLIRDLNFASIEEEYEYEIDRNDTHIMLVKLLIEKKLTTKSAAFKKKIYDKVDLAKEIRLEADTLAEEHEYKEAITKLEESTSNLVKAIRMGGIFIPSA